MSQRPCVVFHSFQDTLPETVVDTLRALHQSLWLYGGILPDPPGRPYLFRLDTTPDADTAPDTAPDTTPDTNTNTDTDTNTDPECSGPLRARIACVALDTPERFFLHVDVDKGVYYRTSRQTIALPAGPVHWAADAHWTRARETLQVYLPSTVLETLLRSFLWTPAPLSNQQCALGSQLFRQFSPLETTVTDPLSRYQRKRPWTLLSSAKS